MPTIFHRDRFTWLAYFALAFYGFFLNVFGPITPFLEAEFQLSHAASALHFTAFAAGILLIGLGGHFVIERIGRWRSLWLGMAGVTVGAFLLVTGRSPVITVAASFLMGLVGSLILAIVPAALSDRHGEMRGVALSEANVVSSLIVSTAGLLVGWSARFAGDWRFALALIAFAPVLLFLILGKSAAPTTASITVEPVPAGRPLRLLFWVYWIAIVMAVSVEFCMMYWSASYVEQVLGIAATGAAQAVSLFPAGMILGRIAGSRLVQRFATPRVILASILIAGLGFGVFWWTKDIVLALSGLFITGLGVASLYPLLLSLAIGAADGNTVQASARATLASGTAIFSLPLALGGLADAVGIYSAYSLVLALLLGFFLMSQIAGWMSPAGKLRA